MRWMTTKISGPRITTLNNKLGHRTSVDVEGSVIWRANHIGWRREMVETCNDMHVAPAQGERKLKVEGLRSHHSSYT